MADNYFTYDNDANEYEFFETKEEAIAWVKGMIEDQNSEGVGEEAMTGGIGWGKIIEKTEWIITDEQENYKDRDEEWPYDPDWESIGRLNLYITK